MKLPFTKMHGLGNDFVVLDFTDQDYPLSAVQAKAIADRHFGIGCDQILIVEKSDRAEIDFKYRIMNADGGEVGQCGNGARCFAAFVRAKGLTDKDLIRVETLGGDMQLQYDEANGMVKVNMGVPNFLPDLIPLDVAQASPSYSVAIDGRDIEFAALSIGNPHAVIQVEEASDDLVAELGPALESHAIFPERANIGFMQIIDQHNIRLRVFERGVGETIACGSGACAAVASGIQSGQLANQVTAHLKGGELSISWDGDDNPVMMTGPATHVFSGEIEL
ncbi:MAG: diaminopimelate epimerase [Pseudomonadota bacterium]